MFRVIQRVFAADSHAGAERVGNNAEYMACFARMVGVGYRLQRKRAGRQQEIEFAIRDLLGDGVGRGQIVFGIETPDLYVLSVYESAFGDGVQHALNPLVQNRLRNMLKDRHASQKASAAPAMAPVGKQQHARSERYERDAQKQAMD